MDLSLVAPELRPALRRMPSFPYGSKWGRRLLRLLQGFMPTPKIDGVAIEIVKDGAVSLRMYQPSHRHSGPALLWIHGGGYLIGRASQDDHLCAETARELGILVVSAEYRLAPENPYPAALDDCYAAWKWMQAHAATLDIDGARIAAGGHSAGGGLAASLVQRLFDEDGARPLAQWLFSPMLDDRTALSGEYSADDHYVWNNSSNAVGWRSYLGAAFFSGAIPKYAVPARRNNLEGLPPTWIGVGTIDLFEAEDRRYADALRKSDVEVTYETVIGAPHGFESWARQAEITRSFISKARAWLSGIYGITP